MLKPALVLVGCAAAAVAQARPPQWELGATGWYSVTLNDHFGSRPELQLSADFNPIGPLLLRPCLRVAGPVEVYGAVLDQPAAGTITTFAQVSPCLFALAGTEGGPLRLLGGIGLSHHVRFAHTPASAKGMLIVPGAAHYGRVERIDFTDHAGVEALVEASYALTDRLRLSVGAGLSHGSMRMLVEPQENASLQIGFLRYLTAWSVQAGVRWRFGG